MMIPEELEFQIVQYVDGELPLEMRVALEARLNNDADARAVLDEHVRLRDALRLGVQDLPPVNYQRLAGHLSDVIARSDQEMDRVYSLKWLRYAAPIAVAACLMIGFAVTMQSVDPVTPGQPIDLPALVTNNATPSVLDVRGPEIDLLPGESFVDVQIGSGLSTDSPGGIPFSTEVLQRQPSVMMLSPSDNAQRTAPATRESDRFIN